MTKTARTRALVLFSGGQDSTVCLAWALARYDEVETVGFDYGQAHAVELDCRQTLLSRLSTVFPEWEAKLGPDHMLSLAELGRISDTALTRDVEIEMGENGLPTTFVPGRNLLFFTYAAALGYRRGAAALIGGMCETDYSGYPDCRSDTIRALEQAITLGMDKPFRLETPLMRIDKAATWKLAEELGGKALVDLIIEDSHSCYRGDRSKRHDWGYGCGACPACELRAKGYAAYVSGEA
ncbi:7-cyano-7-deazaguanine synthase QueC [Parvibaculum sp.]|uniref:7-cyano-7-deazaguanine synthase QueC n=1 Tax=Parvibaculum sp. TaxID=2024848 RepID=UPI00329895A4